MPLMRNHNLHPVKKARKILSQSRPSHAYIFTRICRVLVDSPLLGCTLYRQTHSIKKKYEKNRSNVGPCSLHRCLCFFNFFSGDSWCFFITFLSQSFLSYGSRFKGWKYCFFAVCSRFLYMKET